MTRLGTSSEFDREAAEPVGAAKPLAFTYSHSGQSRLRRSLIRGVEVLSGARTFERLYKDWKATPSSR